MAKKCRRRLDEGMVINKAIHILGLLYSSKNNWVKSQNGSYSLSGRQTFLSGDTPNNVDHGTFFRIWDCNLCQSDIITKSACPICHTCKWTRYVDISTCPQTFHLVHTNQWFTHWLCCLFRQLKFNNLVDKRNKIYMNFS